MYRTSWLIGLSALAFAAGAAPFDPADVANLEAGEVLVETVPTDEASGATRVSLLMRTRVQRLWEVLLSCERSFEYVEGMRECTVIDGDIRSQRVRQSVKKSWLLPRLDYVIEFRRDPYRTIDFHRVAGDLERLEGAWRFEDWPVPGVFLVTHEIRITPSIPVPRWLVRRSITRDVPDMLRCLRALAGGSEGLASEARDRAYCPQGR